MNSYKREEALESIAHAERAIVASWSNERGENLMSALSDLAAIRCLIEDAEAADDEEQPSEIRAMASALAAGRPGGGS